jgi:hypothetical protein
MAGKLTLSPIAEGYQRGIRSQAILPVCSITANARTMVQTATSVRKPESRPWHTTDHQH